MTTRTIVHHTFVIERHYSTAPERVFSAFADKSTKRRWCVESEGFTVDAFEMDFREGGLEESRFRFGDGPEIVFQGVYQDIVPNARIVFAYTMAAAGARMSASLTTIEFVPALNGTELKFTEQGAFFDGIDSAAGREEGTRGLLEALAKELAM